MHRKLSTNLFLVTSMQDKIKIERQVRSLQKYWRVQIFDDNNITLRYNPEDLDLNRNYIQRVEIILNSGNSW